jgi:hypothetical protein
MLWSLVSDDQEKRKGAQKLKDKYPRRMLLYSLSEKEMLRSELSFNVKYW